jgi:methylmalonyl-CoA epimerase
MIKRIIEIGVAVPDLKKTGDQLSRILGAQGGSIISGKEFDMRAQMFRVGNIEFELMEPVNQDSIIAKFLKTRGEGLHHIALQVEDINETIEWMIRNSVRLINERPVLVDGFKAAFVHPASFGGVLLELIEGNPMWVENRELPVEFQHSHLVKGIGVEGLLNVVTLVEDLEGMTSICSKVFSPENCEIVTSNKYNSRVSLSRIGNAYLQCLKKGESPGSFNAFFRDNAIGLNHVTMKVRSVESAMAFLNREGIHFANDDIGAGLMIDPKEISGILIRLTEKATDSLQDPS